MILLLLSVVDRVICTFLQLVTRWQTCVCVCVCLRAHLHCIIPRSCFISGDVAQQLIVAMQTLLTSHEQ